VRPGLGGLERGGGAQDRGVGAPLADELETDRHAGAREAARMEIAGRPITERRR